MLFRSHLVTTYLILETMSYFVRNGRTLSLIHIFIQHNKLQSVPAGEIDIIFIRIHVDTGFKRHSFQIPVIPDVYKRQRPVSSHLLNARGIVTSRLAFNRCPQNESVTFTEVKGTGNTVNFEDVYKRQSRSRGSRSYPWRVLAITEKDTDMPVNNLVYALASPTVSVIPHG